MVFLDNNELVFSFPDLHEHATCRISFQRTLRIPDDNQVYPLPAGLGKFHLEHVEDHESRLPKNWGKYGGVLLPMYQAEALWINFESCGKPSYPFAVKIAAGKINAISGQNWRNDLDGNTQDYIVIPRQKWLDGFCTHKGCVRQFVAMPLGYGYTAEEQIGGSSEYGGIQLIVYPMKPHLYQEIFDDYHCPFDCHILYKKHMGLAPGGLIAQKIYEDNYGYAAWEQKIFSRCFVHTLNSEQWSAVTGEPMPTKPVSAFDYNKARLPWFEYYDDKNLALEEAQPLANLDSVVVKSLKNGVTLPDNKSLTPAKVIKISPTGDRIKNGEW